VNPFNASTRGEPCRVRIFLTSKKLAELG